MTGPELLRLLLKQKQLTVNGLADRLGNRSLQSQMRRFLTGETRNPRADTLQPVADFFRVGVEAFLSPDAAQRAAQERGLVVESLSAPPRVEEERANYHLSAFELIPPKNYLALPEIVIQLGRAMEECDEPARRAIAALIHDMVIHPESAHITSQRVAALLGVEGNAERHKLSNSR